MERSIIQPEAVVRLVRLELGDRRPNQNFSESGLATHSKAQTRLRKPGKPPPAQPCTCDQCGRVYPNKGGLRQHVRNSHADPNRGRHVCKICEKLFVTKDSMKAHAVRVHEGRRGPNACSYCNTSFYGATALLEHVRTHTGEKPFRCTACGRSFASKSAFRVHERTHSGLKPFSCPEQECGKKFGHKISLTEHLKSHGAERFNCSRCGKAFSSDKSRTVHMGRSHTGEKPRKCTFCPSAFSGHTELDTHLRTHTGEKPFSCSQCRSSFASRGGLRGHTDTHHPLETNARSSQSCTLCDKTFRTRATLRNHILIVHAKSSSAVNCPECGESVKHKRYLWSHMKRSHSPANAKQQHCEFCDRSFKRSDALQDHVKTHTGEKPFSCDFGDCRSAFITKSMLRKHQTIHQADRVKEFGCERCSARYYRKVHLVRHSKSCTGKTRPSS